jgi:hypothetical protein
MTDFADRISHRTNARGRPPHTLLLPMAVFGTLAAIALGFIAYVLWPRWPGATVAPDAPAFPITIHGVVFNVPPAAVRVPMQRRPGAHERIDLVFLWPSLEPPDPAVKPTIPAQDIPAGTGPAFERLFVTIGYAGDTLPPAERARTIYPRYAAAAAVPGPAGLFVLPFRDGTPYQDEDLIYNQAATFIVRCTRDGGAATPGSCLYEKRIVKADVVARFPRHWLADWQSVAGNIDKLIARLRPHS